MTIKSSFSNELLLLWEIVVVMITGIRTLCRPIQSVIILVINKSDSRFAVVLFCAINYHY